jgi:TolB-like protein
MSDRPSKLSQFWQELKRRKVVRVITVYAAAAFVILELTDIVAPSLGLPGWTLNFIIILLCVGFVIAVILSWIYDVHPEGGIVKTEPAEKVKAEEIPKTSSTWKIASYISFVVIIGLIVLNIIPRNGKKEILDKSIAVLPFENMSEEEGNEHFVDGLVEDLLNRISVIEELKVISRTSSDMYRERGVKSIPQIAEELKVAYILEGSVQRYGEKARITVQLIDAKNDNHIWVDSYDRDIRNVFQTQSEIAIQVASELDAILTSDQESQIQEEKTRNIEAFELYQMGRFYWNKRTEDAYAESIKYYEQAIEADPGYGLAYAGLADTYFLMTIQDHIERQEGRDKAVELAYKALELDGNLSEAYTVLGSLYDYVDWDWEKAEDAFQRALKLNPNYSTAHQYYAEHLSIIGRHEEARIQISRAVELNPLSFVIRHLNARIYYHRGYFEEALRELNISDEIQKGHRWTCRYKFFAYYQMGQEDEAFKALLETLSYYPRYDLEAAEQIFQESGLNAVLKWKVENDIDTAQDGLYYGIANVLAMLGKIEEALTWLEKAHQLDKISVGISYNIHFRSLHDHPRYQAILKEMGLSD